MSTDSLLTTLKSDPRLTCGNLQIIACAGAGKTEFISTRIAFLVAEGFAKSENIVAFTFTERAAEELKFRIRSKMRELMGNQPDVGDLYVGTIHSFCFELLKEHVPGFRAFDVLDEGKRYAFVSSISKDLRYADLLSWLQGKVKRKPYGVTTQVWVLNTFIRGVDIVREEMVSPKEIAAYDAFVEAAQTYDEKLHERRFLDFSSMMALTVQVLGGDEDLLKRVRQQYTHITVDEYQDINPIQERLIRLLVGAQGNLCVVGDDDQSIYQWRGSAIKNILSFKERYQSVHTHYLPTNYRSTDGIIELSNDLIKRNSDRHPKSMKHSGKAAENGDIYKVNFFYQADEIDFIVDRIRSLLGTQWKDGEAAKPRGLAYSDIAIFFRSVKYDGRAYLDGFDEAGIPYAVSGVGGLFEAPEVDVVFSIFAYLGDFGKMWDAETRQASVPEAEQIHDNASRAFPLPTADLFVPQLEQLKEEVRNQRRISLQGLYARLLTLLGITNEDLHDDAHEIQMYNLGKLSQAISDYEGTRTYCTYSDIRRFCWFITHFAKGSYDSGAGEDPVRVINAVQVMTLHGTKGLGFPVVFMPYCVERKEREFKPGFLDPTTFDFRRYEGTEEDERRLFYVGVTRAKKFLYITTCKDPGYRKHKKIPSKFFCEVADEYCLTESLPDPSTRKKLPPQATVDDYRFPTNYSELSDYIRCEYDYKLRYIYGFNPIIVQALGYGRQIHNILNILHKRSQDSGRIPTDVEAAEILQEQFYLRYAASDQRELLLRSALNSVLRYLKMWQEDFSLSVKSERNFEMDVENALINGTIDLLKRQNGDENGSVLEIIDFKTGSTKRSMEELNLQVQLYTIAAREALNLNVEKAYVHFLDDKKENRMPVLTTPTQLDLARRSITDAVQGITGRRFLRNPRNVGVCELCDWESICPKKNGK